MRTKTLLAAAAISAAGIASSMAQSNVYSLNVVGYVNVAIKSGFNAVANPLMASPNNSLNTILNNATPVTGTPDNLIVLRWNTNFQDFDGIVPTYNATTHVWADNAVINPGECIMVLSPNDFTNTFVGEVKQGSTTIPIAPGFNGIASPVPIGGNTATVLAQLLPSDNDLAFKWDNSSVGPTAQAFYDPVTYVAVPPGWQNTGNSPGIFGVGEGLFYLASAPLSWVRTFTVQ
jgi:hypothetical protein